MQRAKEYFYDVMCSWHFHKTEVLSCQQDHLVQATQSHRKDLVEKIYKLNPGGTSELE
jgi:voltage-dependent calcium channel alpha-2/delta-3